jgi:protease-4
MGRFFRAVWTGVDGLRKVLHLLLLLFVFSIVIGALSASAPKLPQQAALVIRPAGDLVEQLEGDPYDRALAELFGDDRPQTRVQDIIDGLEFARDDNRIKAVVLELNGLGSAGLSKLQRLGASIDDFRSSGKPVIATADSYGQGSLYLASYADEVYMHPEGIVYLRGFGVYQNYYKRAIDKLKIDWNVFKVGTHKSAVEPYTRDGMSDEDRESMTRLLEQLWLTYRDDVQAARGLGDNTIDTMVSDLVAHLQAAGGSLSDVAMNFGLVDELLTRGEVNERIAAFAGADPDSVEGYFSAELPRYLSQMKMLRGDRSQGQNVAVVVASGEIRDGSQPPGTIGGDSTAELLRRALQDETVFAVVLRVDSPGGSSFASEVIRNEVEALREAGKPVVASMSSVAASGGYWISMAADRIVASPSTITGSIGIFGMFPTIDRTLDTLGISTDGIGSTQWAGELRIDRPMSDDAKLLFQAVIEDGYRDFVSRVAAHRNMSESEVDEIAQGQVWTGTDALENGLVDELGDLDLAIEAAAELAELGADEYGLRYFEKELTPTEQLVLQFLAGVRQAGLDFGQLGARQSALERLAATVVDALSPLVRFNDPRGIYAHCFCALD